LLLGIVVFNATWIMLPIKKLKTAADSISGGNYGQTILLQQKDEIGDLVEAFNRMSQTLQEQSERIELEKIIRTTAMIDAQELERQYLSRELHDGLGQLILAIRMKLDQLSSQKPESNARLIAEAHELTKLTVTEIRNISNHLMPAVLHEFGLEAAIKRLAIETSENSETKVIFVASIDDKQPIGQRLQIYLYRIVQEAINNVIKHAQAKTVRIDFSIKSDLIYLKISDDGKGFDMERKRSLMGNGISNMKERTNLLDGFFKIDSRPGNGTTIEIEIPC
jgi:signal transduction histidine kinase